MSQHPESIIHFIEKAITDTDERIYKTFPFLFLHKNQLLNVELSKEIHPKTSPFFEGLQIPKVSIDAVYEIFKIALPKAERQSHYTPNIYFMLRGQVCSFSFLFRHMALPVYSNTPNLSEKKAHDIKDKKAARVYGIISDAKENGVLISDITRKTPHLKVEERKEIIARLEETNMIYKTTEIKDNNRMSVKYFIQKGSNEI